MSGWLFLDRPNAVDRLVKRLDRLKVQVVEIEDSDSAYVPARMRLSIPWQGEGEIVWHRRWVNDAMDQEDDRITLKFGDEEETVACVWRLLRDKLEKPLVDVIFEKIAAAVEKRVRR